MRRGTSAEAVLAVDLYGTALVLEEFGAVIALSGLRPGWVTNQKLDMMNPSKSNCLGLQDAPPDHAQSLEHGLIGSAMCGRPRR